MQRLCKQAAQVTTGRVSELKPELRAIDGLIDGPKKWQLLSFSEQCQKLYKSAARRGGVWECCDPGSFVLDATLQHASRKLINIAESKSTHRAHIAVWRTPPSHIYLPQLETACIINNHYSGAKSQWLRLWQQHLPAVWNKTQFLTNVKIITLAVKCWREIWCRRTECMHCSSIDGCSECMLGQAW